MIKTNYHTHTNFCDGNNTAGELVIEAIERAFRKAFPEIADAGFRIRRRGPHVPPRRHDRDAALLVVTEAVKPRKSRQPDRVLRIQVRTVPDRVRLRLCRRHKPCGIDVEAVQPAGKIVLGHAVLQKHEAVPCLDIAVRLVVVRKLCHDVAVRM